MDTIETKQDDLQAKVVVLDNEVVNWLIMTGIFFAVAVIAISYRPNGKWYFLGFFGIATILLLIIAEDYARQSSDLRKQGAEIPRRLDVLYWLILTAVGIAFFMMFQVLTHDHTV